MSQIKGQDKSPGEKKKKKPKWREAIFQKKNSE